MRSPARAGCAAASRTAPRWPPAGESTAHPRPPQGARRVRWPCCPPAGSPPGWPGRARQCRSGSTPAPARWRAARARWRHRETCFASRHGCRAPARAGTCRTPGPGRVQRPARAAQRLPAPWRPAASAAALRRRRPAARRRARGRPGRCAAPALRRRPSAPASGATVSPGPGAVLARRATRREGHASRGRRRQRGSTRSRPTEARRAG